MTYDTVKKPLVSIGIITYNHRPYVADALESVFTQHRDFEIEVIVGDDQSSDGTATVVDEYQLRYPTMLRRIISPHNVGMARNLDRIWRACTGRYIALLEGDDWWRQGKLAQQTQFMEAHPECAISGHTVTYLPPNGPAPEDRPTGWPEISEIDLLIRGSCLQTGSMMCRRGFVEGVPEWAMNLRMCDWPMNLFHAMRGKVGFIDRPLSYYRMHAGGVWAPLSRKARLDHFLHAAQVMQENLPRSYSRLFDAAIGYFHFQLFLSHRDDGQYADARKHLWQSLNHRLRARELSVRMLCSTSVRMLFPAFGRGTSGTANVTQ